LDRVAQQSEWLSMINVNQPPIRGRLSSLRRPLFRGRSRQMPESDQSIEQKTWNELHALGHLTPFGQHNENFERSNNHQVYFSE
jgi:hypothetical protein